jgi:antirestriction protein ArdC
MQEQASETRYEKQRRLIAESVEQLQSEEGFKAWVKMRASFRSYSLHNTLLIALQYPEATRVAGIKTWNKLGRRVRKGEKGIGIIAPIVGKIRRERDEPAEDAAEAQEIATRVVGWKLVHVFDVSQTEGDPLPEGPEPAELRGDRLKQHRQPLEALAAKLGYRVDYQPLDHARGLCDLNERRITIDRDLSVDDQVATLIHELAHAQGIDYQAFSRAEAEVIVETAAGIVLLGLGVEVDTRSIPYIAGWASREGDDARKTLGRYADAIDTCARTIERALAA